VRFVVRYADAAELDIAEIFAWYETQSGGLGTEFLRQLKILEAKLERYPEINAVEYNEIRRAFTQKFPYSLHYRIEGEIVHVYGCLHHKRDPKNWPDPNT
jgi:plasmid stabilization system protein ParE